MPVGAGGFKLEFSVHTDSGEELAVLLRELFEDVLIFLLIPDRASDIRFHLIFL